MDERSRYGEQVERKENVGVTTRRPDPNPTLAVAAAGTLLTLVAFTLPLTTLAGTAADLGAGPGAQAWVLSAMSLGAAAGLLSSGAVGDDHGRRRTFLAGALVLAVSSLLDAFAPDALVLILARIAQGLGGAAVLACSLGLIGNAFPAGAARARATGVWGASLGAGVALGPFLATGLAAIGGWRPAAVLFGHGRAGVVSGWNVAAVVTAGFSLLGALTVLLGRERAATRSPGRSGRDVAPTVTPRAVPIRSVQQRWAGKPPLREGTKTV